MPDKLLFLLGGSAAFEITAEEFVPAAGGREASIALLLSGGAKWQRYVPAYTQPWIERGVSRYHPIVPPEDGAWRWKLVEQRLNAASGIFIGGGPTPTYQRLYATGRMGQLIRARYEAGVPVAGVSAGALIAPEYCSLTPDESEDGSLHIVPSLGLAGAFLVGVHFSRQNGIDVLLEAMRYTGIDTGWGIDDQSCAVFKNGTFSHALGSPVHRVQLEGDTYTMAEVQQGK